MLHIHDLFISLDPIGETLYCHTEKEDMTMLLPD